MGRQSEIRFVLTQIAAVGLGCIALSGCGTKHSEQLANGDSGKQRALSFLMVEGNELHAELQTEPVESVSQLPPGMVLPSNPHSSSDPEFVEATARGGSQGRLGGTEMCSALYARYVAGNSDIGIYALEAKSQAVADEREKAIREIWAYNESLDRARVFRNGLVLVVLWIWTDEGLPDCWGEIKATVEARVGAMKNAR